MNELLALEAKVAACEIVLLALIPSLPDPDRLLATLESIQADPAVAHRPAVSEHLDKLRQAIRSNGTTG